MKKNLPYIIKALTSTFFLFILIFLTVYQHQKKEHTSIIHAETPQILEASIRKYVELLSRNQQQFYHYNHQPEKHKIGKYVTKTFMTEDTTITYQAKIVDFETYIFNSNQTILAAKKELRPQPIQCLFDSLLAENGIYHTQTAVGVSYSVLSSFHEWSGDTTSLSIDQRISFNNQGNFGDIHYDAYIDYSFLTFWKAMPKGVLFVLFIINIVIAVLIGVFYRKSRKRLVLSTSIEKGQFLLRGYVVDIPNQKIKDKEGGEKKLSPQQKQLFNLFLRAENYRVKKSILKDELWPNHTGSTTNMTTAVKRFRDFLSQLECGYTVISDPKDDDYYLFVPVDSVTDEQNENITMG